MDTKQETNSGWRVLLFYSTMLLAGIVTTSLAGIVSGSWGYLLCLAPFVGPTVGFITVLWRKPLPEESAKQGAIAGLAAAIGAALTMAVGGLSYDVLTDLALLAGLVLYTVGLSAATALIIGRHRQPALKGRHRQPALKPEAEVTARLNDYEYRPVEPFQGKLSIICPTCNAKHEVAIKVFEKLQYAAYTSAPRLHREAEFPPISYSEQRLRVLSPTRVKVVKVLLWSMVVILGWHIGGVQAGFVAAVVIFPVLGPLAQWLFGKSVPIWLLSCSQCRARIPVATDGKVVLVAGKAVATEVGTEAMAVAGEPARGMPQQTVASTTGPPPPEGARLTEAGKLARIEPREEGPAKEVPQQTVEPTTGPPPPEDAQLTEAGKLSRIGPREERPAKEVPQQTVAPTAGPPTPEDAPLTGAGKLSRIGPLEEKPAEEVPQQTVTSTTGPPASERPEELEIPSPQECRTVYAFVQRALAGQPASLRIRITQLEELHDALMRQFIGQGKPTPEVGRLLDASLHGKCPACGARVPGEALTTAAMFQSGPMAGKTIFVGGPGPHSRLAAGQCPNCNSHELVIYWQP